MLQTHKRPPKSIYTCTPSHQHTTMSSNVARNEMKWIEMYSLITLPHWCYWFLVFGPAIHRSYRLTHLIRNKKPEHKKIHRYNLFVSFCWRYFCIRAPPQTQKQTRIQTVVRFIWKCEHMSLSQFDSNWIKQSRVLLLVWNETHKKRQHWLRLTQGTTFDHLFLHIFLVAPFSGMAEMPFVSCFIWALIAFGH